MNYNNHPLPSLQRIALITITTALWGQEDIRSLLIDSYIDLLFKERHEKIFMDRVRWEKVENQVAENLQHLPQPESFKEKILHFIKPIGLQVLDWMQYHNNSNICLGLPSELCWTTKGTVDRKKTAEALIKNENLPIDSRYKLACMYCLEKDIRKIWNKMSKYRQLPFYRKRYPHLIRQHELVFYWTYYVIKGETTVWKAVIEDRTRERCIPYQHEFQCATISNNKVAAEYFLEKLASPEKEECLIRCTEQILRRKSGLKDCFRGENYADSLSLLLSRMNEEQQMGVFRNCQFNILRYLLEWPMQEFFMPTANRIWSNRMFRSFGNAFEDLLDIISYKVIYGYKDYNYQKLLSDFWQQCPIKNKTASPYLVQSLLQVGDVENLKLVLENESNFHKERIVFSYIGQYACASLICDGKHDLLKFFLQVCISSNHILMKFKEEFINMNKIVIPFTGKIQEEEILGIGKEKMMREFSQIIEELTQKGDKKRALEETSNSHTKKFCT